MAPGSRWVVGTVLVSITVRLVAPRTLIVAVAFTVSPNVSVELAPPPGHDPQQDPDESVDVRVEDPAGCPRYIGRTFRDVRIAPSPPWLKGRLTAAGMRPINNVVDITNYVMLLTGQPLHAFDLDRVEGGRLVVRRARDGEKVVTLDDVQRTLDAEMLVIEDAAGPTSIAGVMGGHRSEVHDGTTRVLMEAATWIGPNINRTMARLNLRSEAGARFEKQLHPDLAMAAQRLAAEIAGMNDGAYVGDRKTYQVMLTMRKQGDKLIFDNAGTAPQVGAINTTYSGWRGSLMTAINELLCWDQLYAIGGALRHIEFQPALGCFTSATHPASVSTAPVQAMEISLYPAYNTISKMLSCDPELKRDVMTIGGTSQFPLTVFRGTDQWGEKFGYLLLDPMVGAIGAFSFRDGIATGGQVRSPICRIGNVEHNEQSFPLLVLYRKENTDSGGAGKFRGGNSAAVSFIPHGTTHITQDTESSGAAIPTAPGSFSQSSMPISAWCRHGKTMPTRTSIRLPGREMRALRCAAEAPNRVAGW